MPVLNTGFEVDASHWTATNGTIVRSTAHADVGTAAGLLTVTGSPTEAWASPDVMTANAGSTYTFGCSLFATAAYHVTARIHFYDVNMVSLSTATTFTTTLPISTWEHHPASGTTPAVAPAGTAFVQPELVLDSTPSGHSVWIDVVDYNGPELVINATYSIPGGYYVAGYSVTASGLTSMPTADHILINRRQITSGEFDAVRGINNVTITSDSVTAADYEFRYYSDNNGWAYDAYVYSLSGVLLATQSTATTNSVTARTALETSYPWTSAVMQSIQQPAISLPLIINKFDSWSMPGRIQSQNFVLGRDKPVVLTDTMGGKTGTFSVLVNIALSGIPDNLFQLLFKYNDTFLFQPFYSSGNLGNFYFKILNVNAVRTTIADSILSTLRTNTTTMLYDIEFIEVDRPIASSAPFELISWQDVKNNNITWQNVKDDHANWLDVLNNPTA